MKLCLDLFKHVTFDNRKIGREDKSVIVVPAVPQFTAAVAEEFLILIGPRRLISLVARIERVGPWRETIKEPLYTPNPVEGVQITYDTGIRKYERELKILKGIKESGLPWENVHLGEIGAVVSPERLDELLVLMSPNSAVKSDEELSVIANEWIEGERAKRILPQPLREEQMEKYEHTFQPREIRLARKYKKVIK